MRSQTHYRILDVLDPSQDRTSWDALRRSGVDQHRLAEIITGGRIRTVPPESHVIWALRDEVARLWGRERGRQVGAVGVAQNIRRPWMLATPDYQVHGCRAHPGGCGLQVQLGSRPEPWVDQAQWILAVTGWDAVHMARVAREQVDFSSVVEPRQARIALLVELASGASSAA